MAVLRLTLEIDSDVYPELYAKLASLGRVTAREEKLRQLAALGLVWELARLHGPAVWDTAATPSHADSPDPPDADLPPPHDDIDLDLGFDAPTAAPADLPVLLDVVAPPESVVEDSGPIPLDEPPPRVKPSRSARLARMKDRGLFQNG